MNVNGSKAEKKRKNGELLLRRVVEENVDVANL